METYVQLERASLDALIKQVADLNTGLRENKLQQIYTEILDGNEAAQYLKVTPQYLRILREKGEILYYRRDQLIRYKKADLDKWLNAHKVGK